jgi:hypothetical protein
VPSDQWKFVYLEDKRDLVNDTRELASVLGHTVTRDYPAALLDYCHEYGFPVIPPRAPADYSVRLDQVRKELRAFQGFDSRWDAIVAAAERKSNLNTAIRATRDDRETLAADVARYLREHHVGIMFEASNTDMGLTPRIHSGGPITTAVLRLTLSWPSGKPGWMSSRMCSFPGCDKLVFGRRDAKYCSDRCRKAASRARKRVLDVTGSPLSP